MPSIGYQATTSEKIEIVSFGAGCFWCVEAVFQRIDGVKKVTSGYQGGHTKNPTYQDICTGATGHAEVVQIQFDASKVEFETLLQFFWKAHDPTQQNRQGPDVGTQYRSAIFTTTPGQREEAQAAKDELNENNTFGQPVVTEIKGASPFYPAEAYHQDYYKNNRRAPYCAYNITPKLEKLGLE